MAERFHALLRICYPPRLSFFFAGTGGGENARTCDFPGKKFSVCSRAFLSSSGAGESFGQFITFPDPYFFCFCSRQFYPRPRRRYGNSPPGFLPPPETRRSCAATTPEMEANVAGLGKRTFPSSAINGLPFSLPGH